MGTQPITEQKSWTEAEYESLSFHDCPVHAFAADPERFRVLLDIDYISEWLDPIAPRKSFSFKIAPATFTFENAHLERLEVESPQGRWTIDRLSREDAKRIDGPGGSVLTEWRYVVAGHDGELIVRATGFRLSLRRSPVLTDLPSLTWIERGGCQLD
jgi:hypothetical protein